MAHSSSKSVLQRELLDTIKSLRTMNESLQTTIEDLRKALAESQVREKNLQEQIEAMTKRLFGRSSEKHMVQSEGQLNFFNEIELESDKTQEEEFPFEPIRSWRLTRERNHENPGRCGKRCSGAVPLRNRSLI